MEGHHFPLLLSFLSLCILLSAMLSLHLFCRLRHRSRSGAAAYSSTAHHRADDDNDEEGRLLKPRPMPTSSSNPSTEFLYLVTLATPQLAQAPSTAAPPSVNSALGAPPTTPAPCSPSLLRRRPPKFPTPHRRPPPPRLGPTQSISGHGRGRRALEVQYSEQFLQGLPEARQVDTTEHPPSLNSDSERGAIDLPESSPNISAEVCPNAPMEIKLEINMSRRSKRKSKIQCRTKYVSCNEGADNLQARKLLHCLSFESLRRWCTYEWFYSAVDYPWFMNNEFVNYLDFAKLSHLSRLTRSKRGTIQRILYQHS